MFTFNTHSNFKQSQLDQMNEAVKLIMEKLSHNEEQAMAIVLNLVNLED